MRNRDRKPQGEWAELLFMTRAVPFPHFILSRPWGDSACYDVGVEFKRRHRRVQVKSTLHPRRGSAFRIGVLGPNRQPYKRGDIDFLAVYLISINRWYIIPSSALCHGRTRLRNIQITPGSPRGKWCQYEEAWHLLRQPKRRKKSKSRQPKRRK